MSDYQLTQRKNKHVLQRMAKIVGITSIVVALICAGYLLTLTDTEDKVMKAFYGSISFFCFMMGLVLQSIGDADLPDLTVPKDKVKPEAMAIWSSFFTLGVIATISNWSVFTEFTYRVGMFIPNPEGGKAFSALFRMELPYVAPLLILSGVLLLGTIVAFYLYVNQANEAAKKFGHICLKVAFVTQILAIIFLVNGIKSTEGAGQVLETQLARDSSQFALVGKDLIARQNLPAEQFASIPISQFEAS